MERDGRRSEHMDWAVDVLDGPHAEFRRTDHRVRVPRGKARDGDHAARGARGGTCISRKRGSKRHAKRMKNRSSEADRIREGITRSLSLTPTDQIVFSQRYAKRKYYLTLRDDEAVNPDGGFSASLAPQPVWPSGDPGSTRSHNASGSSAPAIPVHDASPLRTRFRHNLSHALGHDPHVGAVATHVPVGSAIFNNLAAKWRAQKRSITR